MSNSPISDGGPDGLPEARLLSLLGDWSSDGHGNLARRLANGLRTAINGGMISGGTRLPPERRLAELLSVSRSTVSQALDELRDDGSVTSRQGRGTEVVGPTEPSHGHRVGAHFVSRGSGIDLAAVVPTDGSHLPPLSLRTEDLLAASGQLEPNGIAPLREAIAHWHGSGGRLTEADDIQVTHGAHHAIGLTIASFAQPGAAVAIETPAYPGMLDLIDQHRLRAVPLPLGPGGLDPSTLERALRAERPAIVYLQTGVHNPTGQVTGAARRRTIASILDDHGDAVVVEDNTLADLIYAGRSRPGFDELCRVAPVVTVESLSKVAWAALRIGWLRAPGITGERIRQVRVATDLGSSVPSQLLALQLLPDLEVLAERRRRSLEGAVGRALAQMAAELPDWHVDPPQGSSALWAQLPITDTGPFVALARRHGVHVTPGSVHHLASGPDPHIRLCVDRPDEQVAEGITRLAAAWHDATARRSRSQA